MALTNIAKIPIKKIPEPKTPGTVEGKANSTETGTDPINEVNNKITRVEQLMIVLIVALFLAIIAQVYSSFSMTTQVFLDYKNIVTEYNNKEHQLLEKQISNQEEEIKLIRKVLETKEEVQQPVRK